MAHSKNFSKVRSYYRNKLWDEKKVRDAVVNEWITEEEFKVITGKEY